VVDDAGTAAALVDVGPVGWRLARLLAV
jgi:hypothetical protein